MGIAVKEVGAPGGLPEVIHALQEGATAKFGHEGIILPASSPLSATLPNVSGSPRFCSASSSTNFRGPEPCQAPRAPPRDDVGT